MGREPVSFHHHFRVLLPGWCTILHIILWSAFSMRAIK